MAFTNPQYFLNITTGDRQAVIFYQNENITEVWDKSGKSQGQYPGNQLNKKCNDLEAAGYQTDSNPGWQVPAKP